MLDLQEVEKESHRSHKIMEGKNLRCTHEEGYNSQNKKEELKPHAPYRRSCVYE